jgi:hypothetical protein
MTKCLLFFLRELTETGRVMIQSKSRNFLFGTEKCVPTNISGVCTTLPRGANFGHENRMGEISIGWNHNLIFVQLGQGAPSYDGRKEKLSKGRKMNKGKEQMRLPSHN